MNPIQTVMNTFAVDDELFLKEVFTLDDDTVRRRPTDNTTPIIWLAGHLLNHRRYLVEIFTDASKWDWTLAFATGYKPEQDYPSIAQLKTAWVEISDALKACVEKADDSDFEKELGWDLANRDTSVRGAFLFYCYHEGWHLGQIAYARKALGMTGLVQGKQ